MKWHSVVFDLFGTLVPPFRKREHAEAIRRCAKPLGIDPESCLSAWADTFPRRVVGEFASVADNFRWIAESAGGAAHPDAHPEAARLYAEFTRDSLVPLPGVTDTLGEIAASGRRLGLLTNCAPDVPELFPESELGPFFDVTVFSCRARLVKPSRESYDLVRDGLPTGPGEILYVGDGSDRELSGALAAGMHPVLVTPSLHNTYDDQRPEVVHWTGERIATIPDVLRLLDDA